MHCSDAMIPTSLLRRVAMGLCAALFGIIIWSAAQAAITLSGSSSALTAGGSSVSVGRAGASAGDLLLVMVSHRGAVTVNGVPSGFLLAGSSSSGSGAAQVKLAAYYKVLTSGDPSSFNFQFSGATRASAVSTAWRGIDRITPIDAVSATSSAAGTGIGVDGLTTTVSDTMLIAGFAQANGSASISPPATMVEALEAGTADGSVGVTVEVASAVQTTAGNSGNKVATSSAAALGTAVMLALKRAQPLSQPLYLTSSGVPSAGLRVSPPTTTTLANFDAGRDTAPGLLLARGGSGPNEGDTAKYQRWLSDTAGYNLEGGLQVRLWSAMKDFNTTQRGSLTAWLRQCDGSGNSCTSIATATTTLGPWAPTATWVERVIDFGNVVHTVPTGSKLELKVVADIAAEANMMLAYDTISYPSRLQPASIVTTASISGTVFEDLQYGGGAGRAISTPGTVTLGNATVELYDGSGNWVSSTTTNASGVYVFSALPTGSYFVRVVSGTVSSSRPVTGAAPVGILTYRTDANTGTPVAVTNHVGGTNPASSDAGAASGPASFSPASFVFTAGLSGTSQAVSPVLLSSSDVVGVDFGFNFDTVVNTASSGAGSLRQAIANANSLGGDSSLSQTGRVAGIEHLIFMIPNGTAAPGMRSTLNRFSGGVATIALDSALPVIATPMVIDAQVQPGWTAGPVIELRGDALLSGNGLEASGGGIALRGLIINRFPQSGIALTSGSGYSIQGCWLGLASGGTSAAANQAEGLWAGTGINNLQIGGATAASRNVVSGNVSHGIYIHGGTGHRVEGNYIGMSASGSTAVGNQGAGVFLHVPVGVTVGGTLPGSGNVVSGNGSHGLWLNGTAHTVQGNLIGLNAAGTAAIPNDTGIFTLTAGHTIGGTSPGARNVVSGNTGRGIWLNTAGNLVLGNYVGTNALGNAAVPNLDGVYSKASGNVIGGTGAGSRNLISGNTRYGISLSDIASGTQVQGNTIGLSADHMMAVANGDGVHAACTAGCAIGGMGAGAGNVVSGNTRAGVMVAAGSIGNAILGNSIHGNGTLGIDLGQDGVDVNDGVKTAGAANLKVDHPVFTSARSRGNQLTVTGHVGSAAGQATFGGAQVDMFVSDNDSSGHGEGKTWLGTLTADGSGNFSGTLTAPVVSLAIGTRLTATATDGSSNTSEFGPQVSLQVDFIVNSNVDEADLAIGDGQCLTASGVCTLRAAIAELNAWASLSATPTIAFALPNCSAAGQTACSIMPSTALPAIGRAMVVDAQTQPGWTLGPIVELRGNAAPSFTSGLMVSAAGSAVRGLVIGGFGQAGLNIAASSVTVAGNWIGLAPDGNIANPNGPSGSTTGGVFVTSGSGIVIGGTSTAQRNVLSGNGGAGVWAAGGSVTVIGNHVGTNAAGTAAVGNGRWGISLESGSNHRIGGAAAGEGNLISGNTGGHTGGVVVRGHGVVLQGNVVGLNAAGTAALPNGAAWSTFASGIDLRSGSGHRLGGSGAGEANLIAGNLGAGVRVSATQARISANIIRDNSGLGIDLNADGVTSNDGTTSASAPNNGMDHPVITGAGIDNTTTQLTVAGFVGAGVGSASFAGARIEFFKAAPDPSGHGEGEVYLGTLTADGNGRFNGTIIFPAGLVAVSDAVTATATDGNGNTSEFGPNWTTTTLAGLAPAGFNAFETDTEAAAIAGTIRSKVAGAATSLAVVALDANGTALHAGFTGSVALRWLDARDDTGAVNGNCRASWVDVGAAGTATFDNNARVNVILVPPANGTRSMRLKMTHSHGAAVVTACSTDAFAALPATLTLAASDSDSATAGNTRPLNNAGASGGVVHRAGRPFTVSSQARDATGALMPGYDGTPLLAVAGCVLPASCNASSLSSTATAAQAGVYTNATVRYAEVGAIQVQLTDASYASVDSGDTDVATRTIRSGMVDVGRFVPDSLSVAVSTAGRFATANGACLASGHGATFIGQGFGWNIAPQVTVTAKNAAGNTTALWTGPLMKLGAAAMAPGLGVSAAGSATLARSFGPVAISDLGGGSVRVAANGLDRFVLELPPGQMQPSITPGWTWALDISDASEAAVPGNPTLSASATQPGVAFDLGAAFHSGRLALAAAHGDARAGVRSLLQLQRWTSAGWVTMTEDRGCITVQPQHLGVEAPSGVFTADLCAAPMTAAVTTAGGRAWIALPATPGAAPGRLTLRLAGEAATGTRCAGMGSPSSIVPMGLPWLLGGLGSSGPPALATWGVPHRDVVLRREIW